MSLEYSIIVGANMSSSFLLIKTAIDILDKHLLLLVSDTNDYEQVIIVICRKVKLLRIIGIVQYIDKCCIGTYLNISVN